MRIMPLVAGVDIGSTTAKAIVLTGKVIGQSLLPTGVDPTSAGEEALTLALKMARCSRDELNYIVATGYGRVSAPFADKTVTEITCHGRGAHYLIPDVRTVIDIGGQDSKAISLDENGNVIDFIINDKCAAGTGRFLEFTAKYVLNVPIEKLGEISLKATQPCTISSTCTVFAQTEVVSLIADKNPMENITAGLHSAIASRISGMVRRIGVKELVMLTGGVAKNVGVKKALEDKLNVGMLVLDKFDPQMVGALGAALTAQSIIRKF